MKIVVNLENSEEFRELYVEENEPLENLKYIIEAEFSVPFHEQEIKFDNKVMLNDKLLIREYNVKEYDMLLLNKKQKQQQINNNLGSIFDNAMKMIKSNSQNSNNNSNLILESKVANQVQYLKNFYMNKPDELNMLFNTDPEMAEVLVSMDDKKLFDLVKTRIVKIETQKRKESDEYFKLMNADPNDADSQKKIEEMIKWKNINENLQMAQEYLPETFLPVHMLFINIEINKNNVVALVDTGAQSTIISEDLAKKCGVFNLCDTRYSGIAKGVGTSKIIGVIHAAQLKISNNFVICKLTVIENNSIGFIFGLDNMRSHRCSIDLAKNYLIFPDAGINISFLSDGEIQQAKIDQEEDEVEQVKKLK